MIYGSVRMDTTSASCFQCHHAIIDGVYLGLLFADFFEFLDLIQRRLLCVHDVKESSLWPAIENLVPKATAGKIRRIERVICTGVSSSIENSCDALEAYEHCFHSEISLLSNERKQTSTNRFRVPTFESSRIITECKEKRSTVTGAAIAAACRAFGLLLQPYLPDDVQVLNVPIEVMVNLRRYVANENIFESYPGVAAIHVPITVRIPVKENLLSQDVFWYLARQCSDELRNIIASYEPIRQLSKETKEEINAPKKSGKSKYVICLTNLSNIDGVVKSEQSERFTLTEFPGCTNLAMDDMPIFYIGMYSMRGELHFDIGHCAGYTSSHTASSFCRELVRCLSLKSKL
ncbi:hypothetical protein FSP39_017530 [Pinctada imbricata]|uniref:Condensation domain-containing protein n=1 Tax=Pinctada imbricata TaxID=66713 RepID=A0AA89C413_PINIB|nr:hypothetical protein FSP39_017530 [Pinctada imbricata]